MSFWEMAFRMKWVDAIMLKGAVKTEKNPFGEISVEEYKSITGMEFTM